MQNLKQNLWRIISFYIEDKKIIFKIYLKNLKVKE